MKIIRLLLLAAGLGLGTVWLMAAPASAAPMNGLAAALATPAEAAPRGVEHVRWICGPYGGCRWVRGWRVWGPRPYYGFRPYYHPWWGWRRPFYW